MSVPPAGSLHWLIEKNRVESFSKWPLKGKRRLKASGENMARAGFYHAPTSEEPDLCICAYCGKALDGWEAKDDPMEEHRAHAPDCIWVNLDCEEARAKTFNEHWCPEEKPTVKALAHAGFYFFPLVDSDDNVKCYRCVKELSGWEESDDPIKEHERGTNCKHIAAIKKRKGVEQTSVPPAKRTKRTARRKVTEVEANEDENQDPNVADVANKLKTVAVTTKKSGKGRRAHKPKLMAAKVENEKASKTDSIEETTGNKAQKKALEPSCAKEASPQVSQDRSTQDVLPDKMEESEDAPMPETLADETKEIMNVDNHDEVVDDVLSRMRKADPSMTVEEFHNLECEYQVNLMVQKAEAMIDEFVKKASETRIQLEQLL